MIDTAMEAGPEIVGKRVLLTGASGFIGSKLCERLLLLGAKVHAVSRSQHPSQSSKAEWLHVDLSDLAQVRKAFQAVSPDFVFHLAGEVTGRRDLDFVASSFRANLVSGLNMLIATTEYGCDRLILAGSMEEPDPKEGMPVPASPYAAAKWAVSGYAEMFRALYGTPVINPRIFMVYGPGQRDLKKLIPYVATSFAKGQPPQLMSGERRIDWVYVDDVVAGLVCMLTRQGSEGARIDLGSGSLVKVREVVEILRRISGTRVHPCFGAIDDRKMEQIRVADTKQTQLRLRWKPVVDLETGLDRTYVWYRYMFGSRPAKQP